MRTIFPFLLSLLSSALALVAQDTVQTAFGGSTGTSFDMRANASNCVASVQVRSGTYIDAIGLSYSGLGAYQAPTITSPTSGTLSNFVVAPGTYLTRIDVWTANGYINQVALQTNTGLRTTYGATQTGETRHNFVAPAGSEIVGLVGRSSSLLTALGVVTRPILARGGGALGGSCGITAAQLRVQAGSPLLRIGQTTTFEIWNLPPSSTWNFFVYGFNTSSWNGAALPVMLGAYGAPTCQLAVAPDNCMFAVREATATAHMTFGVPNNTAFCGMLLAFQGLYGMPTYNTGGFMTTFAMSLMVGVI